MNDVKQRSGAQRVIIRPVVPTTVQQTSMDITDKLPLPALSKEGSPALLLGGLLLLGFILVKR